MDDFEVLKQQARALRELAESRERQLERSEPLIEDMLKHMRQSRLSRMGEDSKESLELSMAIEKRVETMLEEWRRRREGSNGPTGAA